jgi:dihydroneopterin aldolase
MSYYAIFVSGLELACFIGIRPKERHRPQRIRVAVELQLDSAKLPKRGTDQTFVSYDGLVEAIRELAADGHIGLVEVMAGRLADHCLKDPRAIKVKIRIEKLDVLPAGASVGVVLERSR